jgi:hypothetical protein
LLLIVLEAEIAERTYQFELQQAAELGQQQQQLLSTADLMRLRSIVNNFRLNHAFTHVSVSLLFMESFENVVSIVPPDQF